MKKEKWSEKLTDIDENFIEEADSARVLQNIAAAEKKRKTVWKVSSVVAACLAFFTAINLFLFLPFSTTPPDVSKYSSGEYYSVITKLNDYKFVKPKYKNNFQLIVASIGEILDSLFAYKNGDDFLGASGDNRVYKEVTDNQVDGVIEGDKLKRSDEYFYYLNGSALEIYSVAGAESKNIASFNVLDDNQGIVPYFSQSELYLSSDCRNVTVIMPYREDGSARIDIIKLDVSDAENIKKVKTVTVSGNYLSSRIANGKMLFMFRFYALPSKINFADYSTFLPMIKEGNNSRAVSADKIIAPDKLSNSYYTVILSIDENSLEIEDEYAFLSYVQDSYVSQNNVYFNRVYNYEQNDMTFQCTEISVISYDVNGFEYLGSVSVDGYIKDRYSLDEYDGMLRVVTTVRDKKKNRSSASLFCVGLENREIIASVECFAPLGEVVHSVRFDGSAAYVCTAISYQKITDPVFYFDLSDIDNITYKSTGDIDGLSTSLINYGEGYLLGIGRGARRSTFKVEVFKESESEIESVCKYESDGADYSADYKAYYVDRKNKLIGFGLNDWRERREKYVLLAFDGFELHEIISEDIDGDVDCMRGILVDDYFYIFSSGGGFKAVKLIY